MRLGVGAETRGAERRPAGHGRGEATEAGQLQAGQLQARGGALPRSRLPGAPEQHQGPLGIVDQGRQPPFDNQSGDAEALRHGMQLLAR